MQAYDAEYYISVSVSSWFSFLIRCLRLNIVRLLRPDGLKGAKALVQSEEDGIAAHGRYHAHKV